MLGFKARVLKFDAGALAWRVNGRDVGTMGRPGQVRDLTITPKTAATIR